MSIAWRAGANAAGSAFTVPASVQAGDLVVIVTGLQSQTGVSGTISLASSNSTVINKVGSDFTWTDTHSFFDAIQLWYFIAGSGDAGSTITRSVTGTFTFTRMVCGAWSGTGGSGIDVSQSGNTASGNETASWTSPPTTSTVTANDWAAYFAVVLGSTISASPGTLRQGSGQAAGVGDSNGSVGGSGTTIGAGTWTSAASDPWGGYVVGLVPAVAVSGSAALSGTGTLTAHPAFAPSAALSGSGTLTAPGTLGYQSSASLSGTGTLTPGASFGPAAAMSGSGTLTASSVLGYQPAVALSGSGILSASSVLGYQPTAVLSGTGTLSGAPLGFVSAALSGTGTLSAAPFLAGSKGLSGTGTLTAGGVLAPSAPLSGAGTLTAASFLAGSVQLSGSGTLTAAEIYQLSAALSGTGTLAAAWTLPLSAALSGTGSLYLTRFPMPQAVGTVSAIDSYACSVIAEDW